MIVLYGPHVLGNWPHRLEWPRGLGYFLMN
jgi:hypothetical protein